METFGLQKIQNGCATFVYVTVYKTSSFDKLIHRAKLHQVHKL